MIRQLFSGALVVLALAATSPALAQSREVGERLIAQSGAPDRFMLNVSDQTIEIVDRLSGLRCTLPSNGSDMTLTVTNDLLQCGYTGGIYSNWMVVPLTGRAGQIDLPHFIGAYGLFQKEQQASQNLQPITPPEIHPALRQMFPDTHEPLRVWLGSSNAGADFSVSLIATDANGYRLMQMIAGPSDPVNALSAFLTSTATPQ